MRRDALALARLLAGTPEFAAALSGAGTTSSRERPVAKKSPLETETSAGARKKPKPSELEPSRRRDENLFHDENFPRDASNDSDHPAPGGAPASEDGDDEDERFADCPLLRAVVACVEEFAEELRSARVSAREASASLFFLPDGEKNLDAAGDASDAAAFDGDSETFAVEDELENEGPACYWAGRNDGRKKPETAADAALLTLAAISHAGWPGWGDAVRRHGVLAAAVVAAEASFALAARPAATPGPAADQRRLRHALMFVARLLAEPASARAASSALRRDGETCRRLARVARAANAHAEQMPRRVGKYLDSVLAAWA